eukprot:3940543-Rhodomonas_salina.1
MSGTGLAYGAMRYAYWIRVWCYAVSRGEREGETDPILVYEGSFQGSPGTIAAIRLRVCSYAVSGTGRAYGLRVWWFPVSGTGHAYGAKCAMRSTELATELGYAATECIVLSARMLLPGTIALARRKGAGTPRLRTAIAYAGQSSTPYCDS